MRPFTSGSDYVNHIGLEAEEGTDRILGDLSRVVEPSHMRVA
jgi:hypothetical protein